jgi:hypothetical protein
MPRGARNPSDVFRQVIDAARQEVLLDAKKAAAFQHNGIRGDERAAALGKFLKVRLPTRFGIGKGEAIDYRDQRTGQLDLIIYDRSSCSPISSQRENLLLPCEALYVVVEVKTVITQKELDAAYKSAAKLRQLKPYKGAFVASRKDGVAAKGDGHRCMYIVFGYKSDLGNDSDWPDKEHARVMSAANNAKAPLDYIDRVIALDRGMLHPSAEVGKWVANDDTSLFLDTFLHIVNFLARETKRREPIDWQIYGPRTAKGWSKISAHTKA